MAMNPRQHCRISVRRWGGVESDYFPIHEFIDSTKTLCADGRHRVLHTHWAIQYVVVPIFGHTIVNADGKHVDVKDMCERDHLLADYGNRFIPTLADFVSAVTVDESALRQVFEEFHGEFAGDSKVSELLLSPLAVTGRIKSLLVTHNSWFVNAVLPRIFDVDPQIRNFDIVPAQFFNAMEFRAWMDNGLACPPSAQQLNQMQVTPRLRSVR
jgi:hypothetical protein